MRVEMCNATVHSVYTRYVNNFNDLFFASHQLWHLCINACFVLGTFLAMLAWDDEFLKRSRARLCGTD